MSRRAYREELASVQEDLLRMGGLVEEMVQNAVLSLKELNGPLAARVLEEDDLLDEMEIALEERCMKLIALQQPLAIDLRVIGTVIKTVTDLERMGDEATNIAEITLRLADQKLIKPLIDIPRMADMTQEMLRISLDSFVKSDVSLAQKVIDSDDQVDLLYSELFDELVGIAIRGEGAALASQAINLIFAARFLERIADHATNVAENVIFMVTGERVG